MTLLFDTPTPCATADPEIFFPIKGGSPRPAKDLCRQCYAREACAEEAVRIGYRVEGVWGGTTEYERRLLRQAK